MKLRNKKTGEIYSIWHICICGEEITSVKQFNDMFEDYTSKEPLITDAKKREAIRYFFSDMLSEDKCVFQYRNNCFYFADGDGITYSIDFNNDGGLHKLEDKRTYTIPELCGEEE